MKQEPELTMSESRVPITRRSESHATEWKRIVNIDFRKHMFDSGISQTSLVQLIGFYYTHNKHTLDKYYQKT